MQTLLIVDDEPNIVEGLASQFERKYGDSVIVLKAFSGSHALSILQNNKVNVVLSDIRMPDVDGLALIEETERLWPHTHFIFLSGFDDFEYIHRASKSSIYRGYLLKTEGDSVVMETVDQEICACEEEVRQEAEKAQMQTYLQRATLESALRGGGSWQDFAAQMREQKLSLVLNTQKPVCMVLGKAPLHGAANGLQILQLINGMLRLQTPGLLFEALLPEEGSMVWLLQEKEQAGNANTEKYIYALFEAVQQQLCDTCGSAVSIVVGNSVPFERIVEQYVRLNNIYQMMAHSLGTMIIVSESDYCDLLFSRESDMLREQRHFSAFVHELEQQLYGGTVAGIQALFGQYFEGKGGQVLVQCQQLNTDQLLSLFIILLDFLRENELDTSCNLALMSVFDDLLHKGNRTEPKQFVKKLYGLCSRLCGQRIEQQADSAKMILSKIDRYIEEHIEDYNLSLTELARVTGFNPSYLSRLYRTNSGKKLSEQIDSAKLRHAKKLLLSGVLVKDVARRTGFASPSAFILFFKRNTGSTPRQFYEEHASDQGLFRDLDEEKNNE